MHVCRLVPTLTCYHRQQMSQIYISACRASMQLWVTSRPIWPMYSPIQPRQLSTSSHPSRKHPAVLHAASVFRAASTQPSLGGVAGKNLPVIVHRSMQQQQESQLATLAAPRLIETGVKNQIAFPDG